MVVSDFQHILAQYLCEKIGYVPTPHLKCIGHVGGDQMLNAVIGYDGFNGLSCQMHVAGEGPWLDRAILKAAFTYPFEQMGCNVVIGIVPSGNIEALRLNKHLGFTEVLRIEGAHPDGALILMTMHRHECRWLKLKANTAGMH